MVPILVNALYPVLSFNAQACINSECVITMQVVSGAFLEKSTFNGTTTMKLCTGISNVELICIKFLCNFVNLGLY